MNKLQSRLSYKFLSVVVFSFFISICLFYVLFVNRYFAMAFFMNHFGSFQDTKSQIVDMQQKITQQHLSKDDKKQLRALMQQYKSLTMTLYSEDDEYIADHILSEDSLSISTSSFWLELYYPPIEDYTLDFYDGTGKLVVQSFQGIGFVFMYLFMISSLCIILFFGIIMHFVRKKMKYILQLELEMKLIENGDLQHAIEYQGNDEITSLAKQLNSLRIVLNENMEKEKEARKANEELITTMSHDLRTPLTSLLGYLEILELKIYKNEEDHDSYIKKCRQKAEQIKMMSDKLFTHFFVYSQNEDIVLKDMSVARLKEALRLCRQELINQEYVVEARIDEKEGQFKGDNDVIDRIFDNAFSNILKYSEKDKVLMQLEINETICIMLSNFKKKQPFKEESTCIGLKSIDKMMKQLNGRMDIQEDDEIFVLILYFPLLSGQNLTKKDKNQQK